MAAAATGVAALTTASANAFANYEQLVGGVETLFGAGGQELSDYAKSVGKTVDQVKDEYDGLMQAQQTVLDNADKAYKTAGMSANEYMETVTGFSASLIQSLGGDTEAAAQKADLAIVDMADNVNKMGNSTEAVQNAYNGFAKQNFSMLDNLRIGYQGTKEEMERLLADAEKLSGVKYDISSFADIVDAIHVIQEEMGIAGTTAKEASETIAGSASAMKASWKNLVTGFGNENANLTELVGQFAESVVTYGKNLIPRIGIILKSIGTVITQEVPKLIREIPSMVGDILPDLTNNFGNLFREALSSVFSKDFLATMEWDFGTAFPNLAQHLQESVVENFSGSLGRLGEVFNKVAGIIQPFVETCLEMLSYIIQTTMEFIIGVAIPALGFLFDAFMDIAGVVLNSVAPALENIRSCFETLYYIVQEAINDYIIPTLNQFIEIVKQLWAENQDKIAKIGELFSMVFNDVAGKVQWFVSIVEQYLYPMFIWLVGIVRDNMDNIKSIFQSAFDVIGGIVDFFIALFKGDWSGMWEAIKNILKSGIQFVKNVLGTLGSIIKDLLSPVIEAVQEAFSAAIEAIVGFFTETLPEAFNSFVEMLSGVWESVKAGWQSFFEFVTDFVQGIRDTLVSAWESIVLFFTETIPQFIVSVGEWIAALPETIAYWLGYALGTFIQWGLDLIEWATVNLPLFIENVATFFSELPGRIAEFFSQIIANVITWGSDMLINAQKAATDFVNTVVNFFAELPGKIVEFLSVIIANIIVWAGDMLVKAKKAGSDFVSGVVNFVGTLPGKIKEFIDRIIREVTSFATNMGNKAAEAGKGFFDRIVQALSDLPDKMAEIGSNIVSGIWSGISAGWDWLIGKVQDLANSLFEGAKEALDINSPSRKFKWIAEMCVAGFDEGMDPLMDPATMTRNIKASLSTMQSGVAGGTTEKAWGSGGFNQTINVYREIATADELARAVKVESKYGLMRGVPVG